MKPSDNREFDFNEGAPERQRRVTPPTRAPAPPLNVAAAVPVNASAPVLLPASAATVGAPTPAATSAGAAESTSAGATVLSNAGAPISATVTAAAAAGAGSDDAARAAASALALANARKAIGAAAGIAVHVAGLDWQAIAAELDARGYAIVPGMLTAEECVAMAAQYVQPALFRSRVVMARHGYGSGEYQYFRYPLPSTVSALRQSLYGPLAGIANHWHAVLQMEARFAPDPAAAAIRAGRLQLPAPGFIWRARVPLAGGDPAVAAGRRFRRRRIRADGAAPAHAVARRGGAAEAGRHGDLPRQPPAGAGRARRPPRADAARRKPLAFGRAPHAGHHLPRRGVRTRFHLRLRRQVIRCAGAPSSCCVWPLSKTASPAALHSSDCHQLESPDAYQIRAAVPACPRRAWRAAMRAGRHRARSRQRLHAQRGRQAAALRLAGVRRRRQDHCRRQRQIGGRASAACAARRPARPDRLARPDRRPRPRLRTGIAGQPRAAVRDDVAGRRGPDGRRVQRGPSRRRVADRFRLEPGDLETGPLPDGERTRCGGR